MSYPHVDTQDDYVRYLAGVEDGSKGLDFLSSGACYACPSCNPEEISEDVFEHYSGGSFTSTPCELCNRRLGGDREPAHCVLENGDPDEDGKQPLVHLDICGDCAYFLAYGQLDDETMMRIHPS